jgi:hypothetical protein
MAGGPAHASKLSIFYLLRYVANYIRTCTVLVHPDGC